MLPFIEMRWYESIAHVSNLRLHILNLLLQHHQPFPNMILILPEILRILLHPLVQRLIVSNRLIHILLVFIEIALVDESKIVQIAVDGLVGLLVFELDVVE